MAYTFSLLKKKYIRKTENGIFSQYESYLCDDDRWLITQWGLSNVKDSNFFDRH